MTPGPWLSVYRERPTARVRLFCCPAAGSSAAAFGRWPELVGDTVEVAAIEYPGRGSRRAEPLFFRLQSLVAALLSGIRPELADRPFAILGHSMGAFVAFEVARHLRRLGAPGPLALFVCGCRGPRLPSRTPAVFRLPDAEFLEHLRALNGTAPELLENPALLQLFLSPLRADFEMDDTYVCRPLPPLDLPIFAYGGADDAETRPDELRAWSTETSMPLSARLYPGDHFFLREAASAVARDVAQDLLAVLDGRATVGVGGD